MSFAKLKQQPATCDVVGDGAQGQGVERHLKKLGGVLERKQCVGALAGADGKVYSAVEIAASAEMVRQFRQNCASIAAAQRLQGGSHGPVHAAPHAGAQFIVQRHPNEVMDELVASVAGVVDNMSGECFVQRFDQLVRAKRLSGAHQHIERKIAADDRGERREPHCRPGTKG